MASISYEDKIDSLRRQISTLEWDLPNIKDENFKKRKNSELELYKEELSKLQSNSSIR